MLTKTELPLITEAKLPLNNTKHHISRTLHTADHILKKIPCYQKLFISREGNYKKQTKNLLKIHKEGLSRDKTVLPLVRQRLLRKKKLVGSSDNFPENKN